MSELPRAIVKWHRFGQTRETWLGEQWEDGGERLAVVSCPLCGRQESFEYAQIMQMMRMAALKCKGCEGQFTLKPPGSGTAEKKKQLDSSTENKPESSSETPKDDGRRDWGSA